MEKMIMAIIPQDRGDRVLYELVNAGFTATFAGSTSFSFSNRIRLNPQLITTCFAAHFMLTLQREYRLMRPGFGDASISKSEAFWFGGGFLYQNSFTPKTCRTFAE